MAKTYTYKVWSRDYMLFVDSLFAPIYRKRINKRKWFFGYWGYYPDAKCAEAVYDRAMLERSGFKKVELVEID